MVESGWWLDTKLLTASMTMVRLATSYSIVTSAEYNYHDNLIVVLSPPPSTTPPFRPYTNTHTYHAPCLPEGRSPVKVTIHKLFCFCRTAV